MACDPATTITSAELTGLNSDIQTIDTVVESSLDTTTTKNGKTINTLLGQLKELGYLPPVTYAGAIVFGSSDNTKTIDRNGIIYAPKPSELPFTTSGTWAADDENKFFVIQSVTLTSDQSYTNTKDTVADMVAATDIVAGQRVVTKGYYAPGDGGGASYLIQTAEEFGGIPDGFGDHTLANGNIAVLASFTGVFNNRQFGITDAQIDYSDNFNATKNAQKTVVTGTTTLITNFTNDDFHIEGSGTDSKIEFLKESETDAQAGLVYGLAFESLTDASLVDDLVIKDLKMSMPAYTSLSGGIANNHFIIALGNIKNAAIDNITIEQADLAVSVSYGSINVTERGSENVKISNLTAKKVRGMGLQLFNSKKGQFSNITFEGEAVSPGSYALFHGLRLNALSTFKNEYNIVSFSCDTFTTCISAQQNSNYNVVTATANNVFQGIQVHGHNESVPQGAECRHNTFNLTATNIEDFGVTSAGADNTFNLDIDGTGNFGIEEPSPNTSTWCSLNNTYNGKIYNATGRCANIGGVGATIDLDLKGKSAIDTDFGLLINGAGVKGRAEIRDCGIGARVNGNDCSLDLVIKDCSDGLIIAGDNNTINLNTTLPVTITGNNNTIAGRSGLVTNSGAGNDIFNLNKNYLAGQYFSVASDSNGYMTITHNGNVSGVFSMLPIGLTDGSYITSYSSTANSVTGRFFQANGSPKTNSSATVILSIFSRLDA